ncbi:MAG: gamma-glutamyl-gamma-aminobutyrate hydrolase family protein, partial [Actinomycetota bacterium]
YGQVQSEHVYGVLPEQDAFETTLACAALRCDKPVLAICRGMQVVNVALGGTLVQEIATMPNASSQLAHKPENFPEGAPFAVHDVDVDPQSRLAASLGATKVRGASFHHQAVDRVGEGCRIVAWSPDGMVEGLEHDSKWLIGVQWHPEDTAHDDRVQQNLYDSFVAQARASMSSASR